MGHIHGETYSGSGVIRPEILEISHVGFCYLGSQWLSYVRFSTVGRRWVRTQVYVPPDGMYTWVPRMIPRMKPLSEHISPMHAVVIQYYTVQPGCRWMQWFPRSNSLVLTNMRMFIKKFGARKSSIEIGVELQSYRQRGMQFRPRNSGWTPKAKCCVSPHCRVDDQIFLAFILRHVPSVPSRARQ